MFGKVLIANRGEIACRIIATARRMGMATVAVHSDADARSRHVAMADHAIRIGPESPRESYLHAGRIIEAALSSGAEAVHPGYGFLSESADFAEAIRDAGLEFIGPPADAMRRMASKDAAKSAMAAAGLTVVPGYSGPEQCAERLLSEAERIGFPVLIKPVDGGGGKGMRAAHAPEEFASALELAKMEAHAAFGNDRVLVEKLIRRPRHIEIQVLGDKHGNMVHLFERECSMQRRFQKVIEEAPAPGLATELASELGGIAVKAAKSIGYFSAGTLEFIADGSRPLHSQGFWFMEMNTRIQVEHPVTELATGTDLVELQFRVAAGERLPLEQSAIATRGHAIEARLYAENPGAGFLPCAGRIGRLTLPDGARIDSGVDCGDSIGAAYDPLIAKIVAHADTRDAARAELASALSQIGVSGVVTNRLFLTAATECGEFASGGVDTGFIEREFCPPLEDGNPPGEAIALAAIGAAGLDAEAAPSAGFSLWTPIVQRARIEFRDRQFEIGVSVTGPGSFDVSVERTRYRISQSDGCWEIGGNPLAAKLYAGESRIGVLMGRYWEFAVADPFARETLASEGVDLVRSPVPGEVRAVRVEAGATVAPDEEVAVVEAMKMEHAINAPRAGAVAELFVKTGDQIAEGASILRFKALPEGTVAQARAQAAGKEKP